MYACVLDYADRECENWSEAMSVVPGQQGVFTVKGAHKLWELALQTEALPGAFKHSTKVSQYELSQFLLASLCLAGSV